MHDGADPRRRKLDELFADEPYLSPTMKARRLHEKLAELNGAQADGPGDLPAEAIVEPGTEPLRRHAAPAPAEPLADASFLTLAEAAILLRRGVGPARLKRLRREVLVPWAASVPQVEK